MYADDLVGMSETPDVLQKQLVEALEFTINKKRRVTASAKECALCT